MTGFHHTGFGFVVTGKQLIDMFHGTCFFARFYNFDKIFPAFRYRFLFRYFSFVS